MPLLGSLAPGCTAPKFSCLSPVSGLAGDGPMTPAWLPVATALCVERVPTDLQLPGPASLVSQSPSLSCLVPSLV